MNSNLTIFIDRIFYQFREETETPTINHVKIIGSENGCSAHVGKKTKEGRQQVVTLNVPGCMEYSIFVHEFLHAFGFHHESISPVRDDFITVNYTNIKKGDWQAYHPCRSTVCKMYGVPYDGRSLMHSKGYAYHGVAIDESKPILISKVPFLSVSKLHLHSRNCL